MHSRLAVLSQNNQEENEADSEEGSRQDITQHIKQRFRRLVRSRLTCVEVAYRLGTRSIDSLTFLENNV